MADPTGHLLQVELCSPGTLRICVHVENVLCLRDFYSQTLKSFRIVLTTMADIDAKRAF